MSAPDYNALLQTCLRAAVEASRAIISVYENRTVPSFKTDGSPVTEADFQSNQILLQHLQGTGIPVISEEALFEDYSVRKTWKTCWTVDPLDGTKEFLKRNDEFAICLALIEDQQPTLGIIAEPVRQRFLVGGKAVQPSIFDFSQIEQPTSWRRLTPKETLEGAPVMTKSRTPHAGASLNFYNSLTSKYGQIQEIRKGSALKFFDLAEGRADVYPRFAPTMEWDIAAGHAIMRALGGTVTRVGTDEELIYNKPSLENPHFVVKSKAFLNAERN